MLTYQVRHRVFSVEDEEKGLEFPNDVRVEFRFAPQTPFGGEADPSEQTLTMKRGADARIKYDLNTGRAVVKSEPLEPVEVIGEMSGSQVAMHGNTLTFTSHVESLEGLANRIELIHYGLPLLLNLDFVDSPQIVNVSGQVGQTDFHWGLAGIEGQLGITTTEAQEQRIAKAFTRVPLITRPGHRRLVAALHSFFTACRLERAGDSPYEFGADIILNLAKTLEALFPAQEGMTIDAARYGLQALGYANSQIEARFIPALALRNQVDVGHVFLALLSPEQLQVFHRYTDRAPSYFRELLTRVCDALEAGQLTLEAYDDFGPRQEVITVLERMTTAESSGD